MVKLVLFQSSEHPNFFNCCKIRLLSVSLYLEQLINMKKTNKTANGTSFHDVTITATPQQLITILGEPNNNSGDGKVNMEWVGENNNGDLITIYDWKENRPINN